MPDVAGYFAILFIIYFIHSMMSVAVGRWRRRRGHAEVGVNFGHAEKKNIHRYKTKQKCQQLVKQRRRRL